MCGSMSDGNGVCMLPGSNGGVGVYMVTAVVVVGWCVRACGKGSSRGVVVWFV